MKKVTLFSISLLCFVVSFAQMNTHFVTTWKTDNLLVGSSSNTSIEIPTDGVSTYLYDVDWNNDGIFEPADIGITGNITHDFGAIGTYTIRIRGAFPHFYANFYMDRNKILSVDQWGTQQWTSMEYAFVGCTYISVLSTDIPDLSMATSLQAMFAAATNFNNYIGNWDVSTISNFRSMFSSASNYNQFIGNWDMSAATDLVFLFNFATNFNQPIGNWDVSGVLNFSSMFNNATNFNQPIGNWDVSSATFFGNMFTNATHFNQPIGNWNVSNATSIYSMFSGASSFNQSIDNWNISNIISFNLLFNGASNFNQPLNNWQFGVGANLYGLFINAISFNQPLNNWNIQNATNISGMFNGATSFNQNISNWDTSSVSVFSNMFENAASFNQDLSSWDISTMQWAFNMFDNSGLSSRNYDATLTEWNAQSHNNNVNFGAAGIFYCNALPAITALQADNWTITNAGINCDSTYFVTTWETTAANETITIPTTGAGYNYDIDWDGDSIFDDFGETGDATQTYTTAGTHTIKIRGDFPRIYFNNGGDKLKIYEVNQWGSQSWTSMESSFTNCENLEITATDTPDLSNATSLRYMFWRCFQINAGLENWDISTIIDMRNVFSGIPNFNGDISNWNTSNVDNMFELFSGCTSFNQDIGNWDVGNVNVMYSMFSGATSFNRDIGNWNTIALSNGQAMFSGATAFNQDIGSWNTGNLANMNALFSGATAFDQNLENWDISSLTQAINMFNDVTLSTRNYDALLIGWQQQLGANSNVTFSGGNSKYCEGAGARALLGALKSWTITDGNQDCESTYFITTWETTTPNETITIPTIGAGYSYDVDWDGDSTFDLIGATANATSPPYAIGTHTIKIKGAFPAIYFNNSGDKDKILQVNQWGSQKWSNFQNAFWGCSQLDGDALDTPDLSNVISMLNAFRATSNFNANISNWDVSNVSNMNSLFNSASTFNQDLNNWNVSKVTQMQYMFDQASIFNQNLNNWDVSKATRMENMFRNASKFDGNITDWDVSNVIDMNSMFYFATDFNQNINAWDVSKVTQMQYMFHLAINYNQPLNNWDVSKVINMNQMFRSANVFDQPLDQWDVASVTNMGAMFTGSWVFNQNINNWNVGEVTTMNDMFNNARLFNQPLNNWNVSKVTNMGNMFRFAFDFNQILNNWNTSQVTYMHSMFFSAYDFDSPINNWDVGNVLIMSFMFSSATATTTSFNQDISNWDVSQVTQMEFMFSKAASFNQDISNWNVGSVESMSSMFNRATTFNNDNQILNWNDTSKVVSMSAMFLNATNFDQDISSWNISSLTNASYMFSGTALSRDNYDALLVGWQGQPHNNNVTFGGGSSQYCLGEAARTILDITDTWTITDGGKYCDDCAGVPIIFNGAWSGIPNQLSPVTITANYDTATDGNFTSCNCTINNAIDVNVRAGHFISTNDLTNNGNLLIDNNGSYIQNSNTSTIGGTGDYSMDRETTPYVEYDYTYWASPTALETINSVFLSNSTLIAGASHINAINDDNYSNLNHIYTFNAANFNDSNNDTFDDEGNDWQNATAAALMIPGRGYIAMGAGADFPFDTNFATGLQQKVFFEGEFNTGNITIPIYEDNLNSDSFQNQNLIGNPYPSAIDINKLMKENQTVLEGTFYFWTHDSPLSGVNPGPNAFDFTNNDYAVATSNGTVYNWVSNGSAATTPNTYIASGQSVMVNTLGNGALNFNNDMRINAPNNSYRPANISIDRVWLNLTNEDGVFRQQLLAFYKNGSEAYDRGLDGVRNINGNDYDFYSIMDADTSRFAIQTQGAFSVDKEIPLGIEIVDSGIFTISIANLQGVFENGQEVFLQDNEAQTIHNLSTSDYTFNTTATTGLDTRFVLKFLNTTLSEDEVVFSDITIYPNPSTSGIFTISWSETTSIQYSITDVTGKIIQENTTIYEKKTTLDLSSFAKGVYFIKIKKSGSQISKKLFIL